MTFFWTNAAEDGSCSRVLVPDDIEGDDWLVVLVLTTHQWVWSGTSQLWYGATCRQRIVPVTSGDDFWSPLMMLPSGYDMMRNIARYGMVWSGWQGSTTNIIRVAWVKCTNCLAKGGVAFPFPPRGWHNKACVIKSLVSPSPLPFPLPDLAPVLLSPKNTQIYHHQEMTSLVWGCSRRQEIKEAEIIFQTLKEWASCFFLHFSSSLMLQHFLDELTNLNRHSSVASQQ